MERYLFYYFIKDLELPVVELNSAEIENYDNEIGFSSISSPRLVFRKTGKVVLVQYLIGNWNVSLMDGVVRDFMTFRKTPLHSDPYVASRTQSNSSDV